MATISMIRIALDLHRIGLPANRAFSLAEQLLRESSGRVVVSELVTVVVDVAGLAASVQARLGYAAEAVVPRLRGRPPQRYS